MYTALHQVQEKYLIPTGWQMFVKVVCGQLWSVWSRCDQQSRHEHSFLSFPLVSGHSTSTIKLLEGVLIYENSNSRLVKCHSVLCHGVLCLQIICYFHLCETPRTRQVHLFLRPDLSGPSWCCQTQDLKLQFCPISSNY